MDDRDFSPTAAASLLKLTALSCVRRLIMFHSKSRVLFALRKLLLNVQAYLNNYICFYINFLFIATPESLL